MCTLLYLMFLAYLVPLLFFMGLVRRTKSWALIRRAWTLQLPVTAVVVSQATNTLPPRRCAFQKKRSLRMAELISPLLPGKIGGRAVHGWINHSAD